MSPSWRRSRCRITSLVSPAWSVRPASLQPAPRARRATTPVVETAAIRALPNLRRPRASGSAAARIVALYFLSGYARLARLRRRGSSGSTCLERRGRAAVRAPRDHPAGRTSWCPGMFAAHSSPASVRRRAHPSRGMPLERGQARGRSHSRAGPRRAGRPHRAAGSAGARDLALVQSARLARARCDAPRARAGVRRGSAPGGHSSRWRMRRSWSPLPSPAGQSHPGLGAVDGSAV